MKFTAQETKYIERLRKLERQWQWMRWGYLIFGALGAMGVILYGHRLWTLIQRGEADGWSSAAVFEIAILWPSLIIKLAIAVCFPVWALSKWHGDPTRTLLLRLLSEGDNAGGR